MAGDHLITELGANMLMELDADDFSFDALDPGEAPQPRVFSSPFAIMSSRKLAVVPVASPHRCGPSRGLPTPPPQTPPLPERARRGVLLGSEIEARWMARAQEEVKEKKRRNAAELSEVATANDVESNRASASNLLKMRAAGAAHEAELQQGSAQRARSVAFAEANNPRETSRRPSRQASRPPQIMPGPSHAVRIAR